MGFVSISFLFLFLPVVFFIFVLIKPKFANLWLLSAGLFFYGIAAPKCLPVLLAVILIAYLVGIGNEKLRNPALKRILFILGVIVLIMMLTFLRLGHLFESTLQNLPQLLIYSGKLIAPIGASFYILQAIMYMDDTYRGEKCLIDPIDFALFISYFPKLISGPLLGYRQFLDQRGSENRSPGMTVMAGGIWRLALGICKKVLIANQLGGLAGTVFDTHNFAQISVLHAWLGAVAYLLQIYLDFSSYSDMAIGISALFGYTLPENFLYPYAAGSLKDFWRRWHISLYSFFRDYVYIPLGGSRNGRARFILSFMLVWLLTGLWHGFSWNFVIWGMTHGILLFIETMLAKKNGGKPKQGVFGHVYTVLAVMVLWCFFRAPDLTTAGNVVSRLIGIGAASFAGSGFLFQLKNNALVLVIAILCCIPPQVPVIEKIRQKEWYHVISVIVLTAGVIASAAYIYMNSYSPFLYSMF